MILIINTDKPNQSKVLYDGKKRVAIDDAILAENLYQQLINRLMVKSHIRHDNRAEYIEIPIEV